MAQTQTQSDSPLPAELDDELWQRIDARLERGDVLVTREDFVAALRADYAAITGETVTPSLRQVLQQAVQARHRESPERYVVKGVQNGVQRAFQEGCLRLNWDVFRITAAGPWVIARFKSRQQVRGLLQRVGVRPSLIDEQACIDHVIQVVSGRREPLQKRDPAEPLVTGAPSLSVVSGSVEEPAEEGLSADGGDSGPLTEEELHRGALIGRVEMRVAGGMRLVPRPLMRSSDDPDQYVLAQRGGVTNQLQPVLRNGAPRLVKRSSSGTWQILTNA